MDMYMYILISFLATSVIQCTVAEVSTVAPPAVSPVKAPATVQQYNIKREIDTRGRSSVQLPRVLPLKAPLTVKLPKVLPVKVQLPRALPVKAPLTVQQEYKREFRNLVKKGTNVPLIYGVNPAVLSSIHANKATRPGVATETNSCDTVRSVPSELRLAKNMWPSGIQSYYTKYTEAYGIPIIGSSKVSDEGLKRACYIVRLLFADRYDVRAAFHHMFGRMALIDDGSQTTDLPEYSHMNSSYDARARGLGAQVDNPTSSAGDDNAKCCCGDRYPEEDILLHELAHGVHLLGATFVIPGFERRLHEAYTKAMAGGYWKGMYASTNTMEYWAVGSTMYFNTRGHYILTLPNGNKVKGTGQQVLEIYDPDLLKLLKEVYPCNNHLVPRCQYKDCNSTDFNKVKDQSAGFSLDSCQYITETSGGDLTDCYTTTCHRGGNAFNYKSGVCQVKRCTSLQYTSSFGGYNIYKLKNTVKFKMTLETEQNQVIRQHCVQKDSSITGRCASVTTSHTCGKVSKRTCKSRGCCYGNANCIYSDQVCVDKKINCHFVGGTCLTNPYYMLQQCPLACGVCQYVNSLVTAEMSKFCQDRHTNCALWKSAGECSKNPSYMLSTCLISCGVCQGQPRCDVVNTKNHVTCTASSREECMMKGCCWSAQATCYKPSDCKDHHYNCPIAAFQRECIRNPNWMSVTCPLSCSTCNKVLNPNDIAVYTSGCQDSNMNCVKWASEGECKINPGYMHNTCTLSCHKCKL